MTVGRHMSVFNGRWSNLLQNVLLISFDGGYLCKYDMINTQPFFKSDKVMYVYTLCSTWWGNSSCHGY